MAMSVGSSSEDDMMVEMNTTPLIDVMLVLLIMFIITIPVQTHAVKMNMPVNSHNAPPPKPPEIVRIDIDFDGTIGWNGEQVPSRGDLEARLYRLSLLPDQPEVHVRPNKLVTYKYVAMVLAEAQRLSPACRDDARHDGRIADQAVIVHEEIGPRERRGANDRLEPLRRRGPAERDDTERLTHRPLVEREGAQVDPVPDRHDLGRAKRERPAIDRQDEPRHALGESERARPSPVREPEQDRDTPRRCERCGEHREQRRHVDEYRRRPLRELAVEGARVAPPSRQPRRRTVGDDTAVGR